jgi:hypothetical protein
VYLRGKKKIEPQRITKYITKGHKRGNQYKRLFQQPHLGRGKNNNTEYFHSNTEKEAL